MIRVNPLGRANLLSDGGYPRNGVIRFAYEVVGLLAGKKLHHHASNLDVTCTYPLHN